MPANRVVEQLDVFDTSVAAIALFGEMRRLIRPFFNALKKLSATA
jgi:hypothetical protein